ncbi:MAG: OmpA family protein, partial [Gammaproteobacteria bacterium]
MIIRLKSASKLLALAVTAMVLNGCAVNGITSDWRSCAIAAGVVGGGVSASQDTDHELAYAAGSAVVAGTLCALFGADKDQDLDGVVDGLDECPNTPKGVQVDSVGCPVDSDGDGVPDYLDACPNTPPGVEVDSKGCALDNDGDGVPNTIDQCPNTPRGTMVDAVGCALVTVLENIDFEFDSAELDSVAIIELDLLIAREQDLEAKHGIL